MVNLHRSKSQPAIGVRALSRVCLVFCLLCFSLAAAVAAAAVAAAEPAPMGLEWGVSAADVAARGVTLTLIEHPSSGRVYTATNLPDPFPGAHETTLFFGSPDRLYGIVLSGGDQAGLSARARYDRLLARLTRAHGPPRLSPGGPESVPPVLPTLGIKPMKALDSHVFETETRYIFLYYTVLNTGRAFWTLGMTHRVLHDAMGAP